MTRKTKSYSHGETRLRGPTQEDSPYMPDEDREPVPFRPEIRNAEGQVRLSWRRNLGGGSAREEDLETQATPLYIQEKIHPSAFVDALRKRDRDRDKGEHPSLPFDHYKDLETPEEARWKWYQHEGDWQNRIIRGAACNVMASLVAKEGMVGKVQMVFFDPPYGISFKQNMQTRADSRVVGSGEKGLSKDPTLVATFRDTYEGGLHSYYDNVFRIATHARELLAESGSFFMQIGEANMARLSVLLEEVFGEENKVATIPFQKSGGSSSKLLPQSHDYLLWFTKDREKAKYTNIYQKLHTKADVVEHMSSYSRMELPDGRSRGLTQEEKKDPGRIPSDARLFSRMPITSQHHSNTGRSEPYKWNGRTFSCRSNTQWSVSHEGLDHLAELNRLDDLEGEGSLRWKLYEDEIPGKRINALWGKVMSPNDLHYVVETAESVIERCILMASEPGDLVLDPTCGSGTTAYVAEKWGRRWITCDSSAVSIALSRQRIVSGIFDWYMLRPLEKGVDAEDDPGRGFVYREIPYVTAASLAYGEEREPIKLVDQPTKESGVVRVSSPFTVESHSPHRWLPPSHSRGGGQKNLHKAVVSALETSGVRRSGGSSERIRVRDVISLHKQDPVTHTASVEGTEEKVAIIIAPDDCTVPADMIQKGAGIATKISDVKMLIVIAFAFDADANPDVPEAAGRFEIVKAVANRDLQIGNLRDEAFDDAFVQLGEPEVLVEPVGDGMFTAEIAGYDVFNPATGNLKDGKAEDIACWMIDTDYNGKEFMARRIHFPGREGDKQITRFMQALTEEIDQELWEQMLSLKSSPFPAPDSGRIAVRIVTESGEEMLTEAEMPG